MKRSSCFLLVFLLSIFVLWCVICAPDILEKSTEPQSQVSKESTVENCYETKGVIRNIGDYMEIEEHFLADYYEKHLPSTGVSADKVFIYDADKLTEEILKNRQGTLIIERCIGIVTNIECGDGQILNYDNERYYIAYSKDLCEKYSLRDGTILVSYMVYSPSNNYIDDIMERYDYVICREYES